MTITALQIRQIAQNIIAEKIRHFKNVSSQQGNTERLTPFNMDELKGLIASRSSFSQKVDVCREYCAKRLQSLGSGSSRETFVLTSRFVIKVALPKKLGLSRAGQAQNEHEVLVSRTSPVHESLIPEVRDYDPNFIWIVSDLVRPLKYEEIEQLVGISYNNFYDMLSYVVSELRYHKKHDAVRELIEEFCDMYSLDNLNLSEKSLGIVENLINFANSNQLSPSDVVSQLGKTRDNRLVIYDYGFTDGIYSKYYR